MHSQLRLRWDLAPPPDQTPERTNNTRVGSLKSNVPWFLFQETAATSSSVHCVTSAATGSTRGPLSNRTHQRHITVHSSTVYVTQQDDWGEKKRLLNKKVFNSPPPPSCCLSVTVGWTATWLTRFHPHKALQPEIIIPNRPVSCSFVFHCHPSCHQPVVHLEQTKDAEASQLTEINSRWFKTRNRNYCCATAHKRKRRRLRVSFQTGRCLWVAS